MEQPYPSVRAKLEFQFMPLQKNCRFFLQNDWQQSLIEKDKKIWFNLKSDGKTIYENLNFNGDSFVAPDKFQFLQLNSDLVQLKCLEEDISMTFIAPKKEFNHLHKSNKMINSLDVTDNGLAVSSDIENKLIIWDADSGELRRSLVGHLGEVYNCRFFPSGVVILSAGADMQLKIWCAQKGLCATTLGPGSAGGESPGGHRAAVLNCDFIDKGRNIISSSKDGTVRLWDVPSKSCISAYSVEDSLIPTAVNFCIVKSCGAFLNTDRESTGRVQPVVDDREHETSDKLVLAGTEGGVVSTLDLRCQSVIHQLGTFNSSVNCAAFLTSDWNIACGTQSGEITCWDMRNSSSPLWNLADGRSQINKLKLLHVQNLNGLVAATGDGSCFLINYSTGNVILELSGPNCEPVTDISGDREYLFTSSRDGVIRKYRLPNSNAIPV